MAIEVWQIDRPKGRSSIWAYQVTKDSSVLYNSDRVSIRFLSFEAATLVACLVEQVNALITPFDWKGNLYDDCTLGAGEFSAHAEHLQGPRRGGIWYCSVFDLKRNCLFHTADHPHIQPRSGAAARWLCGLVISAARI